jgi:hypothetical protein
MLVELVLVIREIHRLQGAARRAVAGIEVQHDVLLAAVLRQADGLHVGVGQ